MLAENHSCDKISPENVYKNMQDRKDEKYHIKKLVTFWKFNKNNETLFYCYSKPIKCNHFFYQVVSTPCRINIDEASNRTAAKHEASFWMIKIYCKNGGMIVLYARIIVFRPFQNSNSARGGKAQILS